MSQSPVNVRPCAPDADAERYNDGESVGTDRTIHEGNRGREPTSEIYINLAWAYRFFNARLFDGKLPPCIITLQRKQGVAGYFSANRFGRRDRNHVYDEIALNPTHFARLSDKRLLSVLVHEMCHLWQHHFGRPARGRYHNREWARKMNEVGLIASETGGPGGHQTGDRMGHYIREGGPFDVACDQLLASGSVAPYVERESRRATVERERKRKRASKTAYRCENCGMTLRGKPGLRVRCDDCDVRLVQDGR
jgi:predicted SprT family Zn-dependent metalloprotease